MVQRWCLLSTLHYSYDIPARHLGRILRPGYKGMRLLSIMYPMLTWGVYTLQMVYGKVVVASGRLLLDANINP